MESLKRRKHKTYDLNLEASHARRWVMFVEMGDVLLFEKGVLA
jgi:hypothetical protein